MISRDACQNKPRILSENKMTSTFVHINTDVYESCLLTSQLDATASQLNSNDAFVLVTPGGSFLWMGAGASDGEKQGAQQLCNILGVSASEMFEGGESGEEKGQRAVNRCYFGFLKPILSSCCLSHVCV